MSFAKEKLRPGSLFRLVEWNKIPIKEQEMLSGLYDEQEVYGVFQPLSSSAHLTQKVAYKEVVLLYLHLERTNNLPRYLLSSADTKFNEIIGQLVLDGILEMEYQGNFVSGTAAVKAIFGETIFKNSEIPDRLSQLSMEAIQYGLLLRDLDMHSLSHRLYTFNTLPWDAGQKEKFNADHSAYQYVCSSLSGETKSLLIEQWQSNKFSAEKYWLSWLKSRFYENNAVSAESPIFKLYISPLIQDLPKIVNLVIPVLSESGAFSFKIGNNLPALLRPDKMVVYFERKKEMLDTAASLKKELAGYRSQGVPFTAQADEAGILSWGVDPPDSDVLSAIEAGSWRMKVSDQLALAILQAQHDSLDFQESMHFIQAKLLGAGINTEDWTSVNHPKELSV